MPSGINSFPYMRIRMWLIYTHIGLFHLWCYSHSNGNVVIWPIFCDWHRQLSNWQFAVQSVIKVSSEWHSSFQWPSTSSSVKKKMKELTKLALKTRLTTAVSRVYCSWIVHTTDGGLLNYGHIKAWEFRQKGVMASQIINNLPVYTTVILYMLI